MNKLWSTLVGLLSVIAAKAHPLGMSLVPVNDCSRLPRYNNVTSIAGPWAVRVDGCHNSTSGRGDCDVEGYAASCEARSVEEKRIENGFITISNRLQGPKTQFRCNGALQTFEALVPSGAGALDWHAVGIDRDLSSGDMIWGVGSGNIESVQAYYQYMNGNPVDGLFLGSNGQTNWALCHSGSGVSSMDRQPSLFLRLLGKDSEIRNGEYKTSIRIDGS